MGSVSGAGREGVGRIPIGHVASKPSKELLHCFKNARLSSHASVIAHNAALPFTLPQAMSDPRFIDLETKLAYQEDAQQQLSDVVARQQQQIDTLEAALRALIERVNRLNVQEQDKPSAAEEVPPHY